MFADERRLFGDYIHNFMHEAVDFTHCAFLNEGLVSLSRTQGYWGINIENDSDLMIYVQL